MPNWCSTNYAIRGKESELKAFADIFNSLPHKKSVTKNAFGRFWIGNLVTVLGGKWEDYPCKGAVDPCPDSPAYFCGPCPDLKEKIEPENGFLRFSITTAYYHKQELDDLIKSKFPSFEFFWRSTDDCGNFYIINDPNNEAGFEWFYTNDCQESEWYEKADKDRFLQNLRNMCPELEVPDNITENKESYEAFVSKFCEWRDADDDRTFMEFIVFFQI